jgi:hypothetical protein
VEPELHGRLRWRLSRGLRPPFLSQRSLVCGGRPAARSCRRLTGEGRSRLPVARLRRGLLVAVASEDRPRRTPAGPRQARTRRAAYGQGQGRSPLPAVLPSASTSWSRSRRSSSSADAGLPSPCSGAACRRLTGEGRSRLPVARLRRGLLVAVASEDRPRRTPAGPRQARTRRAAYGQGQGRSPLPAVLPSASTSWSRSRRSSSSADAGLPSPCSGAACRRLTSEGRSRLPVARLRRGLLVAVASEDRPRRTPAGPRQARTRRAAYGQGQGRSPLPAVLPSASTSWSRSRRPSSSADAGLPSPCSGAACRRLTSEGRSRLPVARLRRGLLVAVASEDRPRRTPAGPRQARTRRAAYGQGQGRSPLPAVLPSASTSWSRSRRPSSSADAGLPSPCSGAACRRLTGEGRSRLPVARLRRGLLVAVALGPRPSGPPSTPGPGLRLGPA